jgi:hypothetical protein
MPPTLDAAQLCGINAIVACATRFRRHRTMERKKALACALRSSYTAAVRVRQSLDVATDLKQFPYMELLDSNLAPQDY